LLLNQFDDIVEFGTFTEEIRVSSIIQVKLLLIKLLTQMKNEENDILIKPKVLEDLLQFLFLGI